MERRAMKEVGGVVVAGVLACAAARGADVEIVRKGAGKSVIDVSGLRASGGPGATLFVSVLQSDLLRSGWFTIAKPGMGGVVLSGECRETSGNLRAACTVSVRGRTQTYLDKVFRDESPQARALAHAAADEIVRAVRAVRGIASTRIVMVGSHGGRKEIYTCDADGGNLTRITNMGGICIAPNWAPDGGRLVYTSFHRGFPDVYMYDFRTRVQKPIANYPGVNVSADVSPDGKSIALTLSRDGNPELYVKNLRNGKLKRLTKTPHAAEASPSWSPDGGQIVFVSDRAGAPQLYRVSASGGGAKRLTFRGNENVAPDWGPNGLIVYSSKRSGRYQLCMMDSSGGRRQQLTTEQADHEDPSWAPDGRHIAYGRTERYRSSIYILDTLKDPPVRLLSRSGDWYSPSWSP